MSTPIKLAGFLAAVAAIFGLALVGGRVIGPVDDEVTGHDDSHAGGSTQTRHEGDHDQSPTQQPAPTQIPGGLMISQNGYTLALADVRARAGEDQPVSFTITGPDGSPVTAYDVEHEKQLHLIAVRRDFTGFQHVHPTLEKTTGIWSVDLNLTPGTWRVFTDFKATGADALTLGADLVVDGDFEPASPSTENRTATVGDYEVRLQGDLTAGADSKLTLSVSKSGAPVTDLEPYLGAFGHLVALRGGDLAYLHVHPDGTPGDGSTAPGPDVVFYAAVPSAGEYHLYLDFQHDGVVRTAAFTVTVGPGADEPTGTSSDAPASGNEPGHAGH